MQVAPVVEKRSQLHRHLVEQLSQRLAVSRRRLDKQKPQQNSVPFRNVSLHRQAAGLLAADQDILLQHQLGHILEPDRRLPHRQVVFFREPPHLLREGQRLHHRAAQAALLDQVFHQQAENLVGRDVAAVGVDRADPVTIPVGGQADPGVLFPHRLPQRVQIFLDRLRIYAAEHRVVTVAHLAEVQPVGRRQLRRVALRRTVHHVEHDLLFETFEQIRVQQPTHMVQIRGFGGELLHRRRQRHFGHHRFLRFQAADARLDLSHQLRRRRAAECRLELQAVIFRRIVAGRDHHAAGRLPVLHLPGQRRARQHLVGQPDLDSLICQHRRAVLRIPRRQKTGVVADHDPFRLFLAPPHPFGDPRRHQPHVGKCIVLTDDSPPTVGTEFDPSHASNLPEIQVHWPLRP